MSKRSEPKTANASVSEDDDIAKLDFEPWVHTDGEWTPPTNQEWCNAVNPTLIAIRMAWASLYKTKAELAEMLTKMGEQQTDGDQSLAIMYLDSVFAAKDRIGALNVVLECATARLIAAGLSE